MTADDARISAQVDSMIATIRTTAFDLWDQSAERHGAKLNADNSMLFAAGVESGIAATLMYLRGANLLRPLE
jgi:hypothetical protein